MSDWKMKRFWKDTSVAEAPDGYTVLLDGRAIKTPGKTALIVPTRAMAEAMAAEWDAQEGGVQPDTMPVTKSANSALDKVIPQFGEVADMLANYADTDLLCYRAGTPQELVSRQEAAWDPILDWCAKTYDAPLHRVQGVMYLAQPKASLETLRARVHGMSAFELTGFHELVTLPGSLVLGLAVMDGKISAGQAWDISRIDEAYQAEQWGEDAEAEDMANAKRGGLLHGWRFCQLLQK